MRAEHQASLEVFPPGEFIKDELEARSWLATDFATILGVDKKSVSEILAGKRCITPEMARRIGDAFGTSAEVWLRLDIEYQLHKSSRTASNAVAERAEIFGRYPVREMVKRGWIKYHADVEQLNLELRRFSSCNIPQYAARIKEDERKRPLQRAWIARAYQLARTIQASSYTDLKLQNALNELRSALREPSDVQRVPHILSSAGVRLIVLEQLPTSHIDGACFWLSSNEPVVAISARLDRIDNFWFTLAHELQHVKHGHAKNEPVLDIDLLNSSNEISNEERIADSGAANFLVPQEELRDFIARVKPFFSDAKIRGFSSRLNVHPGIVVGQLQRNGAIEYSQHRKHLVRVRNFILPSVTVDGWGMNI